MLSKFTLCSGLKINRNKTEGIWIGSNIGRSDEPLGLRWSLAGKMLGIVISADENTCINANFNDKLNTIQSILSRWKNHKMTLYGKITIINTLVIPQVLYASTVLKTPEQFLRECETIIRKFIWDDKPSKIKHTTLILDKERGGLNLQDIRLKSNAIRIRWITELLKPGLNPWKAYLDYKLKGNAYRIPFANIREEDSNLTGNDFYDDILNTWCKLHFKQPININEILGQNIWMNSNLKINGKMIKNKELSAHGINIIADLVHERNKKFKTLVELKDEYNINMNQMYYNSLINAIPLEWRKEVKDKIGQADQSRRFIILNKIHYDIEIIKTRDIYLELRDKIGIIPTSETKWLENYDIQTDEWERIYKRSKKSTSNVKIWNMQYKILNRIIACRKWLFKCKKADTELCECHQIEDIEHFYYTCKNTQKIWVQTFEWWSKFTDTIITVNIKEIIFGIDNVFNLIAINRLNTIILLIKYYIYVSKMQSKQLIANDAITLIKEEIMKENEANKLRDHKGEFTKTWGDIIAKFEA